MRPRDAAVCARKKKKRTSSRWKCIEKAIVAVTDIRHDGSRVLVSRSDLIEIPTRRNAKFSPRFFQASERSYHNRRVEAEKNNNSNSERRRLYLHDPGGHFSTRAGMVKRLDGSNCSSLLQLAGRGDGIHTFCLDRTGVKRKLSRPRNLLFRKVSKYGWKVEKLDFATTWTFAEREKMIIDPK